MKVPFLVFMSEIKTNLTQEKNQVFCFFHAKMLKKLTYFQAAQCTLVQNIYFQLENIGNYY